MISIITEGDHCWKDYDGKQRDYSNCYKYFLNRFGFRLEHTWPPYDENYE